MSTISTITLDCGMPLIVETMEGVRSAGVTWLLPAGTARDPEDKVGLSAMIAEMLMRGAGTRSSREFADACDRLGASCGASNEGQFICIGGTMLGGRVPDVLPLMADMVLRPLMAPDAVEPTRDLCLQAIESLKDDPQERVMHLLRRRHNPTPINRLNLGDPEGIKRVRADELGRAWSERARPVGSVLAVAGDVRAEPLAKLMNALLKGWSGRTPGVEWSGAGERGYVHEADQTNQVQIGVCFDAPSERDDACWLERVAMAVLSGGMSGRLFTEVREKRGLCYSVYASYASEARYGRTVAYSGTTPERAQETLDVLAGELKRIHGPAGLVEEGEFQRAIVGLKSKLVMSGESSGARAGSLARDWHKLGRPRALDELAARYDAVTRDALNNYLERRRLVDVTVATIGPSALVPPAW